jgi:hypothetical protein
MVLERPLAGRQRLERDADIVIAGGLVPVRARA